MIEEFERSVVQFKGYNGEVFNIGTVKFDACIGYSIPDIEEALNIDIEDELGSLIEYYGVPYIFPSQIPAVIKARKRNLNALLNHTGELVNSINFLEEFEKQFTTPSCEES